MTGLGPFDTITVQQTNGYAVIDNVRFGANADTGVPEPATWAMMIAGFGLVGGAMRRRKATVSFA